MDSRQNDIDDAAKGTCEWLLLHDKYRAWLASDRCLLWIKGKPGSGKSTLLGYALKHVLDKSDIQRYAIVLSFFFHNRGSELQRTGLGLYRSLLHQLLCAVPTAAGKLREVFDQRCRTVGKPGEQWQWHLRELQDFFQSSLTDVLKDYPVWLFIDALDESGKESAVTLVKEFKSLLQELQSGSFPLHICFSCRHYPIVDRDGQLEVCVEHENRADIATYVQAELSESRVLAASTIPEMITERAEGVFMWARLVVHRVLELDREGAELPTLERQVDRTPRVLHSLYQTLVQTMKPASLKLIQWICFATRPLSLDELRWAMAFDANSVYLSLDQCQNARDYISDNEKMRSKLKVLSCGLAEVVEASKAPVVQFIHESVKDFFVKKGLSALDGSLRSLRDKSIRTESEYETDETESESAETEIAEIRIGEVHHHLSRTCIRYLAAKEIGQYTPRHRDELTSTFPFLHYATTSWIKHVQESEARGIPQDDLLDYFAWPSDTLMQLWVKAYRLIDQHSSHCPAKKTLLLHVASRYQLLGPLRVILAKIDGTNADISSRDQYGRTPLHKAVEYGHEAVVQLLIGAGAAVDAADRHGWTPLHWAAGKGHEAVVQLLVEAGAAVDAKDRDGYTPLHEAALEGYEAIVRLLIEAGAAVDAKAQYGYTPLHWAARNGYEAIVRLLIGARAAVDAKDQEGCTPLHWAALGGHEAVVQLLIEAGAAVDAKAQEGYTPLHWAVRNGHEAVVRLLVGAGAAVDLTLGYSQG
jgi:ankyrin repeat protein